MKIEETFFEENEFLRNLLDSIPIMCLVVDQDVRILFYNAAATPILGVDKKSIYMKRGGDALHCFSSTETPAGCGHVPACAECIIRNSVTKAIQGGKTTRVVTKMKLVRDDCVTEIHLMVSVSPFQYAGKSLAVLFLEDITETIQLRDMMPICSRCRKIRTDDNFWESVEEYLATRHDVYLSHGLCPDCMKILYPTYIVDAHVDTLKKHPPAGGTETVLVAEDDDQLRDFYEVILTQNGYKVILARDGEEVISSFNKNKDGIQLVIINLKMPTKNGNEAAAEMIKLKPNMKFLYLSDYAADGIDRRRLREQNIDFIIKPVSPNALLRQVREILDAPLVQPPH